MAKVIVHIDLNAFFVRCEEIRNPSLENKPVAIGHIGRAGVVSTCSYEARKYGVHSAMPMNKALELCPELLVIHPDFHFYSMMSHRFRNYIRTITFADIQIDNNKLVFVFQGNGFIKYQIRNMIGFLIKVGENKKSGEEIPQILEKEDRRMASITAHPEGLYLTDVVY